MPRTPPSSSARLRARVLAALRHRGLLLESDPRLPSVAAIVAGAPVRGSWWSHPAGRSIFATCEWLHEHRDAACVPLVRGKRTYVHRRLWPALLAVALARDPWQVRGLGATALRLLERVERAGSLRLDAVGRSAAGRGARAAAALLERRLLVRADSVHTERGAHARVLASWRDLERRVGARAERPASDRARAEIERAAGMLLGAEPSRGDLPWLEDATAPRAP